MVAGIVEMIGEMAASGYTRPNRIPQFDSDSLLLKLRETGSELWLDTGDREKALSIWKAELSALTTNNTLANQVVQSGVMDNEIRAAVEEIRSSTKGLSEEDLIKEIGFIINCKIALRLIEAFDVKVSVELHPDFARDKETTMRFARRYFQVCPSHFIVKIPLTPEGLLAVRELAAEGIPINFTLGFSARQNYLAARLSNPEYSNVFLGRLNAVVADNKMGDGKFIGEKVVMATQTILTSLRQANPDIKTKLIGASIRNGEQLHNIEGVDVLTIPPAALENFLEMDLQPESIINKTDANYSVSYDKAFENRLTELWEVDEVFRSFADVLLTKKLDHMSGDDLITLCEQHSINLFHRFTDGELEKIQKDGKIPVLSHWDSGIAIDDLMTKAALQSFAQDQSALDGRIRQLLV